MKAFFKPQSSVESLQTEDVVITKVLMMNLTQCSTRQQKSGELEHSNLAYRKPTQE